MFLLQGGPWRKSGTEEGTGAAFPGEGLAGGEGKQGGKREGLACYLPVVLVRAEVVRSGGSTERGGWRQVCSGTVVLQRRKEGAAGLGRFTGSRAIRSGRWFGERVAG